MPSNSAFRLLARADNAGGASNDIFTAQFDPENLLMIAIRIAGYGGGGGIARVQFNLDTGTTAYAWALSDNLAAVTTAVAGVANGINVAQTSITGARALINMFVRNLPAQVHGVTIQGNSESEAAATAPKIVVGSGLWTNTAQITRVTLNGGGVTLTAGSEICVYGVQG